MRQRNVELVRLQEESGRRQEEEKRRIAEQIEAERRATEKYKVGGGLLTNGRLKKVITQADGVKLRQSGARGRSTRWVEGGGLTNGRLRVD